MRSILVFALSLSLLPGLVHASGEECTTFDQKAARYHTSELLAKMRGDCGKVVGNNTALSAFITKDDLVVLWGRLMSDPFAPGLFIADLNDQSAPFNYRLVLLSIAGTTRIPSILSAVEELAENDPNAMVRREAITALGNSGLVDVFGTLIQVWATETDNEARARALQSLGFIGNQLVWSRLHSNFSALWAKTPYDPLPSGQSPAILNSGQEAQLRSLFAGALSDQSYIVRIAAADSIGRRNDTQLAHQLIRTLVNETPSNRTASTNSPGILIENKMVKVRLISTLRMLHASNQENALISFLSTEHDPDVLAVGLDVLGVIGSSASSNLILAELSSPDDFVAFHAAQAAASLGQTSLSQDIQGRLSSAQDSFAIQEMTEAVHALAN